MKKNKKTFFIVLIINVFVIACIGIALFLSTDNDSLIKTSYSLDTYPVLTAGINEEDEIQLVDGSIWFLLSDSSSNEEYVTLISKYNLGEITNAGGETYYKQVPNTTFQLAKADSEKDECNYGKTSIAKAIEDKFYIPFKQEINKILGLSSNENIVSSSSSVGAHTFLHVLKLYNYQGGVNTQTNMESYGFSVYLAPDWLWLSNFWIAEDCIATAPYDMNEKTGLVARVPGNPGPFGLRPEITVSKKAILGDYKITNNIPKATVNFDYTKAGYLEGETINFTMDHLGYELVENSVKMNGTTLALVEDEYTFKMPASDVTLTATLNPINYSVEYDLDGGVLTTQNPTTYNVETGTITLNAPTKEGYTFVGWYESDIDGNLISEYGSTIVAKDELRDLKLKAKWQVNQYSIEFLNSDNTLIDTLTQDYNTDVQAITAPPKDGYHFDGWYTDTTYTTKYEFNQMPAQNIKVYAKYLPIIYKLEYVLDGGTLLIPNIDEYTIETESFTLNNPSKIGYKFIGWKTTQDSEIKEQYTINKGTYGNITFVAQYEVEQYTITYNLNGGQANNPTTYTIETDTFKISNPTREGHTFLGWTSPSMIVTAKEISISKGTYGDLVFEATWEKNPEKEPEENNKPEATVPEEDKTTGESNNTSNKQETENNSTTPVNKYTINFESNGGSKVESIIVEENATIKAPTNPKKDGYSFAGWYTNKNYTEKYSFDTMPSENITLYAKWQTRTLEKDGIKLESIEGSFDEGVTFVVKVTEEDLENYNKELSKEDSEMIKTFEISLYKNGNKINHLYNQGIKVAIPLEKIDLESGEYELVLINSNGTLESIKSTIEDDNLVFNVDELNEYGVTQKIEIVEKDNNMYYIVGIIILTVVIAGVTYCIIKKRKK